MKKILGSLITGFCMISNIYAIEITKVSEFSFSDMRYWEQNMAVKNNNLFVVGIRGLQIYEVQDDSLILLKEYNIEGQPRHIIIKENYAYVAIYDGIYFLCRIDISDIYEPMITDTLHSLGNYDYFIDGNHLFANELLDSGLWKMHVYDTDTFQEIVCFNVPHGNWAMSKVGNGLGIVMGNYQIVYLYDISNPDSISLYSSGYIGDSSFPWKSTIIQDTFLVIASDLSKVKFFDISNPSHCELIHTLDYDIDDLIIWNELMILRNTTEMWLYDVSDPHNPLFLDHIGEIYWEEYNFFSGITNQENIIFVSKVYNSDINCYSIEDNIFDNYYNYYSNGTLISSYLYNDNIYISTRYDGIKCWNISNLYNPVFVQTYYDDYNFYQNMSCDEDIIALSMIDKTTFDYFHAPLFIEPNGDISVLDMVGCNPLSTLSYRESTGFFTTDNSVLFKYELDDDNELTEVCTLDIPISSGKVVFWENHPDIAYILGLSSFIIVDNITSNDSIYVGDKYPSYNYYQDEVAEYFDYAFMSTSSSGGDCAVYEMSDPLHPILNFIIEKSGPIAVDKENGLLFIGNLSCTVYDLGNIEEGYVDSLYTF
ncbi:MAG: hypothetical protein RAP70_00240, partial [Candidatus Celaenobacter antarcticus]|nr:hypothetical protein [Candidatus Celaenobacter antarcticus]